MIDITAIPAEILSHRGAYSTVRAAHEDTKKELQMLCGQLTALSSQILRRMQPDNDAVPESIADLFASARVAIANMERCVADIESLAQQRADLKPLAWPK